MTSIGMGPASPGQDRREVGARGQWHLSSAGVAGAQPPSCRRAKGEAGLRLLRVCNTRAQATARAAPGPLGPKAARRDGRVRPRPSTRRARARSSSSPPSPAPTYWALRNCDGGWAVAQRRGEAVEGGDTRQTARRSKLGSRNRPARRCGYAYRQRPARDRARTIRDCRRVRRESSRLLDRCKRCRSSIGLDISPVCAVDSEHHDHISTGAVRGNYGRDGGGRAAGKVLGDTPKVAPSHRSALRRS